MAEFTAAVVVVVAVVAVAADVAVADSDAEFLGSTAIVGDTEVVLVAVMV